MKQAQRREMVQRAPCARLQLPLDSRPALTLPSQLGCGSSGKPLITSPRYRSGRGQRCLSLVPARAQNQVLVQQAPSAPLSIPTGLSIAPLLSSQLCWELGQEQQKQGQPSELSEPPNSDASLQRLELRTQLRHAVYNSIASGTASLILTRLSCRAGSPHLYQPL